MFCGCKSFLCPKNGYQDVPQKVKIAVIPPQYSPIENAIKLLEQQITTHFSYGQKLQTNNNNN